MRSQPIMKGNRLWKIYPSARKDIFRLDRIRRRRDDGKSIISMDGGVWIVNGMKLRVKYLRKIILYPGLYRTSQVSAMNCCSVCLKSRIKYELSSIWRNPKDSWPLDYASKISALSSQSSNAPPHTEHHFHLSNSISAKTITCSGTRGF